MKDWLPHLIVGNLALALAVSAGVIVTMEESRRQALVGDFANPGENETVQIRTEPIVWSGLALSAIGAFYVAAALAGFKHREEKH